MPIDRDVLYVFSQPSVNSGGTPDVLLTTQGTYDLTTGQTIVPNTSGATIGTSAALNYNTVFFIGNALYATDPTTGETVGIATGPSGIAPSDLTSLGSSAVFVSADGNGGAALVSTNGMFGGTNFINPAGAGFNLDPTALVRLGGVVLFDGVDANGAHGLWRTDGTDAGTFEVTPSAFDASATEVLGVTGGRAIFATYPFGGVAAKVISTDGTAAGTQVLDPALGEDSSASLEVSLPAGPVLFTKDGAVLYAIDGLDVPTLVANYGVPIGQGGGNTADISDLAVVGQRAAFVLRTETTVAQTQTLMISDGTPAGTFGLDVDTGSTAGLKIGLLTTFGSQLLFVTVKPQLGIPYPLSDLWITDGTQAGTRELAAGINPVSIAVDGGRALVVGFDVSNSRDVIYTTDGTAQGTTAQLNSGSADNTFSPGLLDPTHVFVSGTHDQYDVAPTVAGAMAVADTVPGRDGAATESGARIITFADGIGVLDPTGNAEALARIYQSAFDRAPDIGGLIAYTTALDAGSTTLLQVANIGAASPEFIGAHGDTSNAAFVTALYQNTVGRLPDAGGLAGYVADLNNGFTRGAVLLDISQSFEARHDGLGVAGQANDATVYRLYETVVDRAPDLAGQQAYSAALSSGISVQTIASAMLASGEYASVFGNPSNGQFITDLYQNLLHRAPDAGGLAAYTADLASGTPRAAVVAAFATGDEGRLTTALATHDGWVYLG